MDKQELKPCPCGETPTDLHIYEGDNFKYREVSGNCCGEWGFETRVSTIAEQGQNLEKMIKLDCIETWNDKPRGYPSPWIPVSERLPEEGQLVFVYCHGHNRLECVPYIGPDGEFPVVVINWWTGEKINPVTHWMEVPLPPLPKEN